MQSMNKTQLTHHLLLWCLALALISGCAEATAQGENISIPPTITATSIAEVTPIPAASRAMHSVPTAQIVAQAATEVPECPPVDPDAIAARHVVSAQLDYGHKALVVDQQIDYAFPGSSAVEDLALNIEPARYASAFTLLTLSLNGEEPAHTLDGRRLTLALDEPLEPGCTLSLRLTYEVRVPPVGEGAYAYDGYFGYTNRQLNLGHWLATVAPRVGDTWITRDTFLIGEQEVLDSADWDVTIRASGGEVPLTIAAPGELTREDDLTWHFVHQNSRDFSASISQSFNVIEQEAEDGTRVEIYTFDDAVVTLDNGTQIDGAPHALDVAARSLAMYADLFGEYPYSRLIIVQGDFPDGMEFSGLAFVGGGWFTRYTGDPASYLTLITVHEVAHQWWYGRVGNDAALTPWMDEALSTYSEYIFLEEYYPQLRDWWWQFRVDQYAPQGFVDSTIYEFSSIREYINAVYLRGVRMLHALRDDLGTDAFFDWLADYVAAGDGQIATPDLFWSLLTPEQIEATQATRDQYLRAPIVTEDGGESGF
jgi:hypothetical protein